MGGDTHYWFKLGQHNPQRWAEIFPRLSLDAGLLIDASGISIKGPDGEGEPILTENTIALNGDEDEEDAHETFDLCRNAKKNGGCCKTGYKTYDIVVTAILIRAAQLLGPEYMDGGGRGEISSDTEWDEEEWLDGRSLVERVFPGEQIVCPWTED